MELNSGFDLSTFNFGNGKDFLNFGSPSLDDLIPKKNDESANNVTSSIANSPNCSNSGNSTDNIKLEAGKVQNKTATSQIASLNLENDKIADFLQAKLKEIMGNQSTPTNLCEPLEKSISAQKPVDLNSTEFKPLNNLEYKVETVNSTPEINKINNNFKPLDLSSLFKNNNTGGSSSTVPKQPKLSADHIEILRGIRDDYRVLFYNRKQCLCDFH